MTPIGPAPGPPPPCGVENVLCRLNCMTSAPMCAGLHDAHQGVEVGAVEVDQAAARVHRLGDLRDVALEQARACSGW